MDSKSSVIIDREHISNKIQKQKIQQILVSRDLLNKQYNNTLNKNLDSINMDGKVISKYGRKSTPLMQMTKEQRDAATETYYLNHIGNISNNNNTERTLTGHAPNQTSPGTTTTMTGLTGTGLGLSHAPSQRSTQRSAYSANNNNNNGSNVPTIRSLSYGLNIATQSLVITLRRDITLSATVTQQSEFLSVFYPNDEMGLSGFDLSAAIMATLGNDRGDPVSLIIYEFDYVLATLPNKLDEWQYKFENYLFNQNSFEKFENEIVNTNLDTFLYMFGGPDRVYSLSEHLSKMLNVGKDLFGNDQYNNDNDKILSAQELQEKQRAEKKDVKN